MSFTLRDWWGEVTSPKTLLMAAVLTAGCVIAGPFGTIDMPFGVRAVYWPMVNAVALMMSLAAMGIVHETRRFARWPVTARNALGAALFAVPFSIVLHGVTRLFVGAGDIARLLVFVPSVFAVAFLIAIAVTTLSRVDHRKPAEGEGPSRLMARLQPRMRGRLIRLGVQDHYVEVHTAQGMSLILMRLGDAVEEVGGVTGHRVHRSHWVAEQAIRDIQRRDGRVFLMMEDGAEVPVSRSYQKALREAGLL
ncbi:hypothetical protein FHS89_001968 [Rubricella aquisinus]|uniref:HTH LytTR-type domain-containing protein n=1 Tax=Rubricella aquisinus TaxID=2028108 RepID=A0A840WLH7_9RHOB|nr:LytTR family DNA-binding domain-containing protein [Rubricella aquisinus]MBB5515948.1 hypothetical protein [Rubricella aquisinus]